MPQPSDELAALKLFEYVRDEREKMTRAVKNIISIYKDRETEGVHFDEEFAEFVGHFANIKGFLSKRDQAVSEPMLHLVRLYDVGAYEVMERQLLDVLALPIDYKCRPWKKISAQVISHGFGAGASVER